MAQIEEYTKDTSLLDNLLRDSSLVNADESIDSIAFDQMVEELPSGLLGSGVFAVSGTNEGIQVRVDRSNAVGYIQSRNFVSGTTGWRLDTNGDFEGNSGTFRGSLIAGNIHIPDQDTTANSFHVDTTGAGWVGATETNRATAPMRWTAGGNFTATSGTFGAWTISGNTFTTTANNILIGTSAGAAITTGVQNVLFGLRAGDALTEGINNVFISTDAGDAVTTGSSNILIGVSAGSALTTGTSNTVLGNLATIGTTAASSVLLGASTGNGSLTGANNIVIGVSAGTALTTGADNILIGGDADVGSGALNAVIAMGRNATPTASNQMVIGGTSYGINDVYIGESVTDATPLAVTLQNNGASGANVAGASFTIAAGKSTGTGAGGSLLFATSPAGGAGSVLNTLVTAMTIDSAGVITLLNDLAITEGGTGASTAVGARTNLGLGSIATQAANSVSITGGSITSITDLVVADGGSGASTLTGVLIGNGTSAFTGTALGASQSIRMNAGGTAYEAYTPSSKTPYGYGVSAAFTPGGTVYAYPFMDGTPVATEPPGFICPFAGTVKNFYVRAGALSGAQTLVLTVRKNAVDTALTVSFVAADSNTVKSDTVNTFTVVAGDLLTVSLVISGTPAFWGFSFEIDST